MKIKIFMVALMGLWFVFANSETQVDNYIDDTKNVYIADNIDWNEPKEIEKQVQKENSNANFVCDGRKYCSQMKSCEEATYFINHCPNTKMDGNHDGVPCERQWCRR